MSPKLSWLPSRDLFKFWKLSDNILEAVQDRDVATTGH